MENNSPDAPEVAALVPTLPSETQAATPMSHRILRMHSSPTVKISTPLEKIKSQCDVLPLTTNAVQTRADRIASALVDAELAPLFEAKSSRRWYHNSQQKALNAELRAGVEEHLKLSRQDVDALHRILQQQMTQADTRHASLDSALQSYSQDYRSTEKKTISAADLIANYNLKVHPNVLEEVLNYPPTDHNLISQIVHELSNAELRIPPARLRQRLTQLRNLDPAVNGEPLGQSLLSLYEKLQYDVFRPMRHALINGESRIIEVENDANLAGEERRLDLGAADDTNAENVRDATLHHQKEISLRSQVIGLHASRWQQILEGERDIQSFLESSEFSVEQGEKLSQALFTQSSSKKENVNYDISVVRKEREAQRAKSEAITKAYQVQQDSIRQKLEVIKNNEIKACSLVVEVLTKLSSIVNDKELLVQQFLKNKEKEDKRQRAFFALERGLETHSRDLLIGQHTMNMLAQVSEEITTYVAEMKTRLYSRDLAKELEALKEKEASRCIRNLELFAASALDLEQRRHRRLENLKRDQRQIELNEKLAVECLDPHLKAYREEMQIVQSEERLVRNELDVIRSAIGDSRQQALPILLYHASCCIGQDEGHDLVDPIVELQQKNANTLSAELKLIMDFYQGERTEMEKSMTKLRQERTELRFRKK